ncbi:beta-ketoacyl synthase [Iamia sp. SCSIO 61187]|uniref:beta-ketoacyl-[acyl-carrier-protein] synthase family protein n=1 Tax=Iamia sp. SCSIO 61187 TaxID=2722752 RepID=UPI002103E1A2|nr:beta-ketoacyl-ACP synthase II [Iamia sp. SCSIO 61187]
MTARRRVAVTGMGVVSPAGTDLAATMAGVVAAKATAAPITLFDATNLPVGFACEVAELDVEGRIGAREARRIDRSGHLALIAAADALADAGLGADDADRSRVAVVAGSGVGGLTTLEEQVRLHAERGREKGPRRVSPMTVPMMMANGPAALVSIAHGFTGPSLCVATACATGANAIGEASRLLRDGTADVAVAGATECAITPTAMSAFANMGALSRRSDDPGTASRPFDVERDGFVMGEGAGFLVLETWEHAVGRGARIHGELLGYGTTCDASHITAPSEDGAGAAACLRLALASADLAPADVRHINAHGTSTPLNDAAEARAMSTVFGPGAVPVTSTKGVMGHLIGAAGAVEAVVALASAIDGVVPPVAGTSEVDPEIDADVVVGAPRSIERGPVVSTSFAFGGHNAAVVLAPA